MRTVILVPYRSDGGRRDELWKFTRGWLERHHPTYQIYVGESPEGLFNRSAAINRAAKEAGEWDVAVVCDSDTVVPPAQFEEAVSAANRTGLLASALNRVVELSRESTDRLLTGADLDLRQLKKDRTRTKDDMTQSSVIAVPRALWDAVGGFDEEFCGWGCEDNAFWLAATVFGGGEPLRVDGSAFHLWHELASKIKLFDPIFRNNFKRLRHYKRAETPRQLALLRHE
ncbi:MAG: glycosyltransferase [Mycobacterium sp.]|nr:glycosyltransferase [Mycobacterium sp.]MDT5314399.1 hypothetical protein [Mycobacterium sp.]